MSSRSFALVLLASLALGVLVPTASGARPETVVTIVDETGTDDVFSEECGVPVTFHATGRVTTKEFSGNGASGPVVVRTLNVSVTLSAGDNTYQFRDVGTDHLQTMSDGTLVLMIVGQVPFAFTGVLKVNPDTGEAILEPQHSIEDRVDEACDALTA
jgi:hypothetical protein